MNASPAADSATSTPATALATDAGLTSSGATTPLSVAAPVGLTSEQLAEQARTLQAQLAAIQQQQLAAEERALQEKAAKRKDTIARFQQELGATDLNDLIAILRESARGGVVPASRGSKGKVGPVGHRVGPIPAETIAAMKAAMEAGITETEGVKRFHISPASWQNWKRRFGLTGKGIGGHAKRATAAKKARGGKATKTAS